MSHNKTHGKTKTKEFNIWQHMKKRCLSQKSPYYHRYGKRGITVSPSWLKFENFLNDMGICPEGKSLDRIDNNKGYSKENCKWSTPIEQARNTRTNKKITYKNQTKCIAEWAEQYGLSRQVLRTRIFQMNWSIEKALLTPVEKR